LLHVVYTLSMRRLGVDVATFITVGKDFERARDLFKRWGIKLVILQDT